MKTALAVCFFVLYTAAAQTPVDFYLDMEAGTNGQSLTTNLLNACTHTAPGAGYWTFNRAHPKGCTDCWQEIPSATDFTVLTNVGTNLVWPLRSAISVNGKTYTDTNHTRVFGKGLNSRDQAAQFTFTTPHLRLSLGYYYTMALGYTGQDIEDYILSTGLINYANENDWEYDIMGGAVADYDAYVFVHSQAGGPPNTTTIGMAVTKSYWITQLWDGLNGVCKVEVYDPVTWAKVGNTSQLVLSNLPCEFFQFGDMQNTNALFPVTNCFGNLIMDWTTAAFPLLLPAVAPPSPAYLIVSWTPTNSATLENATNASGAVWQTYSNNATPPMLIPIRRSQPVDLYRVRSTRATTMSVTPR
jgi:hypothetical protein